MMKKAILAAAASVVCIAGQAQADHYEQSRVIFYGNANGYSNGYVASQSYVTSPGYIQETTYTDYVVKQRQYTERTYVTPTVRTQSTYVPSYSTVYGSSSYYSSAPNW